MKRISLKDGSALLVVMIMTVLAAGIAAMMIMGSGSQILRSRGLVWLEQAFYVAEGGAERAASYIASSGPVPTTLSGTLGSGSYRTIIIVESGGGLIGTIGGMAAINPNNSSNYSFLAVLPDNSNIDQTDLSGGRADYNGPVKMAFLNATGSGSQTTLLVNGSPYTMQNANTYSFTSADMQARVYNTHRDANGQPTGQWRIELTSANASVGSDVSPQAIRRDTTFTIHCTGNVQGHKRSVTIRGLQTVSWAKYALWYNSEASELWIKGGESFRGPVYANTKFHFSDAEVSTKGKAHFYDQVATTASSYDVSNASAEPIFDMGITKNADVQTMATVDLAELKKDSSLTLEGDTTISFSNKTVRITNSRKFWTNSVQTIPNDGLVYVQNSSSGTAATKPGNISLSGTNGSRVTLVAEGNINITGHVVYKDNPVTNPNSTDALGLIANSNIIVKTSAPNNLVIQAHMIAKGGGFGVENYDTVSWRGLLNVYGGIVNKIRNAVGTTGTTGYSKNYTFDPRFKKTPPPRYPAVPDEFQWLGWEG